MPLKKEEQREVCRSDTAQCSSDLLIIMPVRFFASKLPLWMLTDIVFGKDRSLCDEQGTDLDQLGRWTAHPEAVQREDSSFTQEE